MIEVSAAADVQRGKENIPLDLKSEAGQQRLRELVAEADVVVRNMRPEAAKSLGVDADSIHAIRPEAIRLARSGAAEGISGSVSKAVYLGSHIEYVVQTQLGDLFVIDPNVDTFHATGDAVSVSFVPHGVTLVPGN